MGRDRPDLQNTGEMHDATYLRARAQHLRAAAATAHDPEIARALRQVAGDFDNEASSEEARAQDNANDQRDPDGSGRSAG